MTIRKRLTLSFLVVLILFGLNLVVFFWSSQKRKETVEELRQASTRQLLMSSIREDLSYVQMQVNLLSQLPDPGTSDPTSIASFSARLDAIGDNIRQLRTLSQSESALRVAAFEKAFQQLGDSWRKFYGSLGVRQSTAIEELAIHAEPLSQQVMQQLLPDLQRHERALVEAASTNFYAVARLTAQITILIFSISAAVALLVAWHFSRYLVRGLRQLKEEAALIGAGSYGR